MCKEEYHPITHQTHQNSFVSRQEIHHRQGGHVLVATATPLDYEADKPPILICNGYGAGIGVTSHLMTRLSEVHGRVVVAYNDLRAKTARTDPIGFRGETIISILDHFDKGNDSRYAMRPTLAGWSTGGAAAVRAFQNLAASGEGERIGAIVPIASAGIGKQASEAELFARATLEVARAGLSPRALHKLGRRAVNEFATYLAKDIQLALREVSALSALDIAPYFDELDKARVANAPVAMERDLIFPLRQVRSALGERALKVVQGTHINMAWDSRVADSVAAALEVIETDKKEATPSHFFVDTSISM